MGSREELVALGEVTPNNVGQLRKLNSVIFPVAYTDKFYTAVLETPALARIGTATSRERARRRTVRGGWTAGSWTDRAIQAGRPRGPVCQLGPCTMWRACVAKAPSVL